MAEYVSSCSSKKSTKITLRSQQNSEIFRELKCSKTLKKTEKSEIFSKHQLCNTQITTCATQILLYNYGK